MFRDSFNYLSGELEISTSVDGLQYIGYEGTHSGLHIVPSDSCRSPQNSHLRYASE